MSTDRRDLLIRAALTPLSSVVAPPDLADAIASAVRSTPQARPWPRVLGIRTGTTARVVIVLAALLLAILVGLAIASRPSSAPIGVFGYHGPPSRTGVMPGPLPTGTPVVAWTAPARGPFDTLGMPLVADGAVYAGDGSGFLTSWTLAGGTVRWSARLDQAGASSVVLLGGLAIHGSEHGRVTAVDVATGGTRWTREVGGGVALSLATDGSTVVASSLGGTIAALDAAGGLRWSTDVGGPLARGAAIADGVAVVGASTGRVVAIRIADGSVAWQTGFDAGEYATPAIDRGAVYVAHGIGDLASAGVVISLDVSTGQARWRWTAPTITRLFVGAVEGSDVYVLTEDGAAFVLDATTGSGRPLIPTRGSYGALAAIVDGRIVLANADRTVTAYDRTTGTALWSIEVSGVPSTPSVIDGRVLVGTDLGTVIAIADPVAGSP
jgi:outer membrane protein assembly factor BamB